MLASAGGERRRPSGVLSAEGSAPADPPLVQRSALRRGAKLCEDVGHLEARAHGFGALLEPVVGLTRLLERQDAEGDGDAGLERRQLEAGGGLAGDVVEVRRVAAMALAKTRRYACIVALGCVIRGDTPHFDFVAGEAASGLQLAALETGVPVAFGVLTLEEADQADDRLEKGAEAVRTGLEMADVFAQLRAAAQR